MCKTLCFLHKIWMFTSANIERVAKMLQAEYSKVHFNKAVIATRDLKELQQRNFKFVLSRCEEILNSNNTSGEWRIENGKQQMKGRTSLSYLVMGRKS